MHYFAAAVVPKGTMRSEAEAVVEPLLKPFNEETSDDGWWDWWQVGGRWTGVYAEYNPQDDPANKERCRLCDGTGTRTDMQVGNGCNGCAGTGVAEVWPTNWAEFEGDVVPVSLVSRGPDVTPLPAYVVFPDGSCIEAERWNGEEWDKTPDWPDLVRSRLATYEDYDLVVLDVHS